MALNSWTVRTISGSAGGLSREARVTLEVNCTSDTIEDVRQLVEAAPELLAALQAMLQADEAIRQDSIPKSDQAMLRIAALDAAYAAIAKATGQD